MKRSIPPLASPTTPRSLSPNAVAARARAAALVVALALPVFAAAADPGSINRIEAPPCAVLVTPAGAPAQLDCRANGNDDIRSWGEAANASGVLQSLVGAEVRFEAIQRSARSEASWVDSLVWLGGAAPSRVVFEGLLVGGFAIDITRGSISPAGVEQGVATARLELRATAGGVPAAQAVEASLARSSAGGAGGTWTEAVQRPLSLALDWAPAAPGATLGFEQRLLTSATARNDWFRQGGGAVDVQAGFLSGSGLVAVRFFGGDGQELGDAVQWGWAHGVTPVPEPHAAVLWLAGLLALALWAPRRRLAH